MGLLVMFIVVVGALGTRCQRNGRNDSGANTSLTETQLLQKLLQQEVSLRQELDRKVNTLEKQVQSLTSKVVVNGNGLSSAQTQLQGITSQQKNMAASIQAITNHVNTENELIKTNITKLSLAVGSSINLLQAKVNKEAYSVAFLAKCSNDVRAHLGPIRFDHSEFNVGSAYKTSLGIFVVPIRGIYSFSTTAESDTNNISTYISRNGVPVARVTANKFGSQRAHGSATVTLHLETGDRVWVQWEDRNSNSVLSGSRSLFSGFLVYPDM